MKAGTLKVISKSIWIIACMISMGGPAGSQDFSNRGKEFWIPFAYHYSMAGTGPNNVTMTLYLSSDQTTNYTVEIFGGVTVATGVINAGNVVRVDIPQTYQLRTGGLQIGRTVRVIADKSIVVYSYITEASVSSATICLPTNVLGKEYVSMNFDQRSNSNNSNSYFTIIATEDNTNISIKPSAATTNGWVAGNSYNITLNKGQIFQVLGTTSGTNGVDLTGSTIQSIPSSPTSGCKSIAVFSGSGKINIGGCGGGAASSDNLYQQLYPTSSWGKSFLTVPSYNRPINFYRIIKSVPTANVYVNGTLVPAASFNANGFYTFSNNQPNSITSDQPICVAQFFTTMNCLNLSSNPYDPEMIILNPVEQNISKVTLVSSNLAQTTGPPHQHHLHVIIPAAGNATSSFLLDGNPIPSTAWTPHPGNANYMYAYLPNVAQGYHTISSDSGFNAIAYGYAQTESYGYSAGANVKDLYQFVSMKNTHSIVDFPATCQNTPFKFSITLPYQPTSLEWKFGSTLNGMGIPDEPKKLSPTADSTYMKDGKTLYLYRLNTEYKISTVGTYSATIVAGTPPTAGACSGGLQDIDFDIKVYPPPQADFTAPDVCIGTPMRFTDNSTLGGASLQKVTWLIDGTTRTDLNPFNYPYATPGSKSVSYEVISNIGCISPVTTKNVNVKPLPTATIAGDATLCLNSSSPLITFTGANGTPPYRFAYTLTDPSGAVTTGTPAVSAAGSNSATVTVPTTARGKYIYTLTSVTESVGTTGTTACSQNQTGTATVTILPTPTATITGGAVVCLNTPAQITLTGSGGDAPYTFEYNIDGIAQTPITSPSTTSSVSLPVPTNNPGTFIYELVKVRDANGSLCQQTFTGATQTVTVKPLPTATLQVDVSSICLNGSSPTINFTGANGTPPYRFAYTITDPSGAVTIGPPAVSVTGSNTATVTVPTTARGRYIYTLTSVTESFGTTGTIACSQNQTGSVTVNVLPIPSANITGSAVVCLNSPTQITFTGSGGDAPYTFEYNIDGNNQTAITTASATTATMVLTVPTNNPGSLTYELIRVRDANGTLCQQSYSPAKTATITVKPLPTATIDVNATTVCMNGTSPTITFKGDLGTPPYRFTYNRKDPSGIVTSGLTAFSPSTGPGSDIATVTVPTGSTGTYEYTLVSVIDAATPACSQPQSGTVRVTVWPLPTAAYTSNSPVCATGDIAFTDKSVPNSTSLSTWQWNFNDPTSGPLNTSTVPNPSHVFQKAGTYNITLTVTNSNGCVSTNTLPPFIVHPKPEAGYIIPEVCLEDTYAQFLDTSKVDAPGKIMQWSWNFGDAKWNDPPFTSPNTAIAKDPTHRYKDVGNYDVSLIVTSDQGCMDTIVQRLVVNGSFPVPKFEVQNPTRLCANESIAIIDQSTVFPGVITKVEIYWDDIGAPTVVETDQDAKFGKVYKHLYPNFQSPLTKTYRIRFLAYSGGTCVKETSQTITVNAAPKTQFDPLSNICFDATPVQITQAREVGGVPGTFAFTGPGVSTTGLFSPAIAGEGTHVLTYKFSSTAGGCADSVTQTIKVWKRALADFEASTSPLCEKQPVTLTDKSSSQEGTLREWRWDYKDGSPVETRTSATPFPHTFPVYASYPVTLTVVTSDGCISAPKTVNLAVLPLARPNFTFPPVSCLPDAVIPFTNSSTVPGANASTLTYLWDFGDPGSGPVNASTAKDPAHTYATLGPFNVKLKVTTQPGCVHDTTIVLNTIHPQPIASFTVSSTDVCLGGALRFDNTSNTQDGTLKSLLWDLGDGSSRTATSFSHTYSNTGLYNISLQIVNSFDCKSTIANQTVSVNPNPIAKAGPNRTMLEGAQITIEASATNANGLTYLWTPSKGLNDPRLLRPIASPDSGTRYLLTVTSDKGCTDTSSMYLKVLYKPVAMNTFTPNGDGINDTWDILYIDSYPGALIEVYNTTGQLMYRSLGYTKPWDGTNNGRPLPAGTYYYVLDPKNGRAKTAGYVTIFR
jgi:gliding motility-associated-like protein